MQFLSRNRGFMHEVQTHERIWGQENYPGRPSLDQIMKAKVVAFWYPSGVDEMKMVVTVHPDLKHINEYVTHVVWHTRHKLPSVRLASVWVNQKEVRVKGVKVIYEGEK